MPAMKKQVQHNMFRVIGDLVRKDVLYALDWESLSYTQLRKIATDRRGYYQRTGLISYHLRKLKKHHLIEVQPTNRMYYLTVRGSTVVRAMKEIENSEMFI